MSFEEMQSILQGILLSQQQFQSEILETKVTADRAVQVADRAIQVADRAIQIAESNGRAIQAMLDQAATDRLQHEERKQQHEERIQRLENLSEGLINLTVSIDEDRPTILRLLNSNNNKLDTILDRLPPPQQ
jgi:hypothetical protein